MKKFLGLFCVLTVVLIFAGCSGDNDKTKENTVVEPLELSIYGLNGPSSMGMIKLFEEKPSFGENVIPTFTNVSQPDEIIGKLVTGEIDIAAVPTNVASIIYNKTEGNYKLAAVNTLGVLYIMTAEGTEINNLEDLRGKTIGASGLGSVPEYVLNHVLKENGIDPENDVTIDFSLSHADLAQGIISGKIEIALLPQPFVTMVTMSSDAKIAISMQDEWSKIEDADLAMGCIIVRADLIESRPEVVNSFLSAYKKSVNWVNENPIDAGVLIEKFEVLPKAKMAELAIPNSNIVFFEGDDAKAQMEGILKVLFDFNPKSIGGKLPDEKFYYKK